MASSTEIVSKNLADIQGIIASSENRIASVLPKHIRVDKMISVAMELIQGDTKLRMCTPQSIITGLIDASQLGLLLMKNLGHGYLVPYHNGALTRKNNGIDVYEAKFMIGYRGFIELVLRGDDSASNVFPRIVYPGDQFQIFEGTRHEILHVPNLDGGQPYEPTGAKVPILRYGKEVQVDEMRPVYRGAYAVVIYQSESHRPPDYEWMPQWEVEKVRAFSKAKSEDSPWNTWPEGMILKTPIRRLCKRLKLSPEVIAATVADELGELGIDRDEGTYTLQSSQYEIQEPKSKKETKQESTPTQTEQKKDDVDVPGIKGEVLGKVLGAQREAKKTPQELAAYIQEQYNTDTLSNIPATEAEKIIAWLSGKPANGNGKKAEAESEPEGTIGKTKAKELENLAKNSGWTPMAWQGFIAKEFSVQDTAAIPTAGYNRAKTAAEGGA